MSLGFVPIPSGLSSLTDFYSDISKSRRGGFPEEEWSFSLNINFLSRFKKLFEE